MSLAEEMFAEVLRDGQSARQTSSEDAGPLRSELRRLALEQDVRLRTALVKGVVIAARTDAQVWRDDTATMRAKLTPPDPTS